MPPQGGERDGQVRFDRITGPVVDRAGCQVVLGHAEGLLDLPQVVVVRHDLVGGHHRCRHVGDVALEPDEPPCSGQAGLIEEALIAGESDESGGFGGFGAVDNCLGAGLLGGQGADVTAGAAGRVVPDRPPGFRMLLGVPDRFGPQFDVVDCAARVPWGDGVDNLPVGETLTVPMEMGFKIVGGFGHAGTDDERKPCRVERFEVVS